MKNKYIRCGRGGRGGGGFGRKKKKRSESIKISVKHRGDRNDARNAG